MLAPKCYNCKYPSINIKHKLKYSYSMVLMRRIRHYTRPKGKSFYLIVGLAGILVSLLVLEITNTTPLFHNPPPPAIIPTSRGGNQNSSLSSPSDDNAGTQNSNSPKSTEGSTQANLPLYAPYGGFVSNHHPGENGSPTAETSVCNTTPGATCYIRFTKGSAMVSLPAQTTDSKGVTYWYWDVKNAGLTPGDWTITAVASLNSQSKSTRDPLPLTVNQ